MGSNMETLEITGQNLTIKDVVTTARYGRSVALSEAAIKRIEQSRSIVDRCVDESLIRYGITTGFGKFSDVVISKENNTLLQKNLVMSHAVGVGNPLPEEVVRAMMLLRVNALAVGNSGIRCETVNALINFLNRGITPVVPEKGSL
ncbi:MAG TPA: aromatic amino acid lyase, partial [Spirochaetales bacterium]|nr:aromatic amino acid lyase [Spirochaetales bacterium]